MKNLIFIAALILLSACNDADVASRNFEISRRIVFYNGITDKYIMSVEGLCSLGNYDKGNRISVTCKTGDNEYKKHYLGLSDNVTFFAEQLESKNVSTYHYRVIFKPQSIVPDIDLRTSKKELTKDRH